jgi:hypothetical protein
MKQSNASANNNTNHQPNTNTNINNVLSVFKEILYSWQEHYNMAKLARALQFGQAVLPGCRAGLKITEDCQALLFSEPGL